MSNLPDPFVVTAGIPVKDGCPVLTRLNAFIVNEGENPTLQFVFRDRSGRPLDLSSTVIRSEASAASQSAVDESEDTVLVHVREYTAAGASDARHVWRYEGDIFNAQEGIVRVTLSDKITGQSGLYNINFSFIRNSKALVVNKALLSIEPSLFHQAGGNGLEQHRTGCPTLQEVRMHMWDSSGAENMLLDDVEFGDEQILLALIKPIQYFNETNPPLSVLFNTTNFPYRSHWIDATLGYLKNFAADFYMRNRLQGAAGGVNIDDLNKEDSYRRAAKLAIDEWKDFVLRKKVELNMQEAVGSLGSTYGDGFIS